MVSFIYRGHYEGNPIDRLERHSGIIAVDTETVNTNDYSCLGIGLYIGPDEGFYFRTYPEPSHHLPRVLGLLSDRNITTIYHNGQNFDLEVLDKLAKDEGYSFPDDDNYQDTEIMAKVAGLPGGLQRLGTEWLGATDLFSIRDLFDEYKTSSMLDVPWERVGEKCLNDCRTTWQLYEYLNKRLTARQRDCYEVDRRLIPVLRRLQSKGLRLRQGVLREYEGRLDKTVLRIIRECDAEASFHPGSNMQVGYVLASRGHVLPFTKSRKQLRVDEEILEELMDDPLAATVLEYRRAVKLLSTYIRPWLGKERAYTHFRLDLATGRLASGRINAWDTVNRNLQNIPPGKYDDAGNLLPNTNVREIFGPDTGEWTWADYSQIELRVLAYVTRDRAMMAEYAKEKPDLHRATMEAAQRYVPQFTRAQGKTFNFARVFGAGDKRLSRATGLPIQYVPRVRAAMSEAFPESETWIKDTFWNHGDAVETDYGRLMRLPEMVEGYDYNPKAFEAHRNKCAVNYIIQGTAADIVKRAMLKVDLETDLRLQVHDEFLADGFWEPSSELSHIHPGLYTPMSIDRGLIWK